MAFCIQDCIDFDDSFVDSESEYEDEPWRDNESDSSASQISVQDTKPNPLQHSQLVIRDILALTHLGEMHRRAYANPTNFTRTFFGECQVCFRKVGVFRRPCCKFVLCKSCFQLYIVEKIQLGITEIECANTCSYLVDPHDIVNISPAQVLHKYHALLIVKMRTSMSRECSCCGNLIYVQEDDVTSCKKTKIICSGCGVALCLSCLRPWHQGVSCRQNKKTDELLKSWAKGYLPGQPKAQKCPKCKIYIERISGCDYMYCTKCGTNFCYRCGDMFRRWKAFGDHSSKLSVFGCKYAFLPNKPFCRKFIRGSLFSTRVCAAVIVGTLAIGVGSAAVCVGAASLPFYGAVRLYQKLKRKRTSSIPESVDSAPSSPNCYFIRKIPNISDDIEQKGKYHKNPDLTPSNSEVQSWFSQAAISSPDSTLNSMNTKDLSDWITLKNTMFLRISLPDQETEENGC